MKKSGFFFIVGIAWIVGAISLPCSAGESDVINLDAVVVTATKYETPLKDIPASVSVIDADAIKRQNLPNGDVGDVLRSVPGVTVRRAYAPFPAYPNIRGLGSDATVTLVNGIPTNWEITQAIPADNIERIEILRGPASALYGANAMGGVINIILKRGEEKPESTVGIEYGSFNTLGVNGSTRGKRNSFRYALAASYEDSDGTNVVENNLNPSIKMIDDCSYTKKKFSMNAGYDLNENAGLSFVYNFMNDEYNRGRPHVGGDWDRHFAAVTYDQKINDGFSFMGYLGFRYDDLLHLYDKGGTNYDPNKKRYTDFYEIPAELRVTGELGETHTFTAGVSYNEARTDQDYNDWTTSALLQENEYSVRTMAGYVQDVWKPVDALIVTAGVRYDHWKNFDNEFSNYEDDTQADRTDSQWSPKVGARYNFDNALSLWLNYGTGFKPPTPAQLYDDRTSGGNPRQPNPDLEPEKTDSWELGIEKWFGAKVRTSLAGYWNITDDKILSWFNDENVWINKNIGETESYGAELALALYLSENWMVEANYTYTHATITENLSTSDLEGNYLPFSPRNKANIGISYTRPDNFTINVMGRYLSDQFTSDSNARENSSGESLVMDESFVVDINAVKQFNLKSTAVKRVDLSLAVDNLFDESYRSYYMYEDPGTVVTARVDFLF